MRWFTKRHKVPVSALRITQDIHTHLLPGVDDGRYTPEEAAEALAAMYKRGVRHVCFTPHIIAGLYDNTPAKLNAAFDGFVNCIGEGIPLPEISLGAEYMVDDTLLCHLGKGVSDMLTVPGDRVLIEMSYYGISPQIFDVVSCLSEMGYRPVLAHPERYLYMDGQMDFFDKLFGMGCVLQLNLFSVTGAYGEASVRIMKDLMERQYYRHVGTDTHSLRQLETIYESRIDEKTALAGEFASLWELADPDEDQ